MRLAGGIAPVPISSPNSRFRKGRLAEFAQASIHRVGEFTSSQLFEALNKRGVSARQVRREIRRMLGLPVLCGLIDPPPPEHGQDPCRDLLPLPGRPTLRPCPRSIAPSSAQHVAVRGHRQAGDCPFVARRPIRGARRHHRQHFLPDQSGRRSAGGASEGIASITAVSRCHRNP
jgi:hypothetical protein